MISFGAISHFSFLLINRRFLVPVHRVITWTKQDDGTPKFKSENLYQLYAYLRTQEHLTKAHRAAEGLLLYPATTHDLTESIVVQGHRIRVATVDLSEKWENIEARLLALVNQQEPEFSDAP